MSTQETDVPMGQCAVTGKMVPEDELVTIHGQRVCAEGKAILLERLKSGETMPGELERPTVMRRFGCIFLDGLIVGVPIAIINGVVTSLRLGFVAAAAISLIGTTLQVIYFGQMHAARGQTVGKIAGKLRVVNLDGTPISSGSAYVRAFAYAGVGFLSGIAVLTQWVTFITVAAALVSIWGLVNVLFALFDRTKQRALHDRIARTRVIQFT